MEKIHIIVSMNEQGTVIEVSGDIAKIKLEKSPLCVRCSICTEMGADKRILSVKAYRPLKVGEIVTVIINPQILTLSSILLYGVPLSGLIAGAVFGYMIGKELWAVIFAIVFMVIDFAIIKLIVKKQRLNEKIAVLI